MMSESYNKNRSQISQIIIIIKNSVKICGIIGLFLFRIGNSIFFLSNVEAKSRERLRLIHADSLVSSIVDGEIVRKLWGNVKLVQGEAFIVCDQAQWQEKESKIILLGRVTIYDGKRSLKSDRVDYDGKVRMETASGNVNLESGNRKLMARNLIYWQESERASASGDVVLTDLIEMATLKGDKGFYDRRVDYGLFESRPQLVKVDSVSGEILTVNGLKMEVWGTDQRVVVTDSVEIEKDELKAVCQKAEYLSEENQLVLIDKPILWHKNRKMKGDRIDVQIEGVKFQGGIIKGSAEIISKDSTFEDVLKGQRITIEASEDTIRKVIVEEQASSLYHIIGDEEGNQGVNSVTGDCIVLTFNEGKLEDIQVESNPGQCTGIYTPQLDMIEEGEKEL